MPVYLLFPAAAAAVVAQRLDVPVMGLGAYASAVYLNKRYDWTGITPTQALAEVDKADRREPLRGGQIIGNVPARSYTAARNVADAKLKLAVAYALGARYLQSPQLRNAARQSLLLIDTDPQNRDPRQIGDLYQVAIQAITMAGAYGPNGPGDKQIRALVKILGETGKADRIAGAQNLQLDPAEQAYTAEDNLINTLNKLNPVPDWINPFSDKPDPKKRQRELILWSVGVGSVVALTLITISALKE